MDEISVHTREIGEQTELGENEVGEHKASPLLWTTKPRGKRVHSRGDPCTFTRKYGDPVHEGGEANNVL
jgi:hypothetical protein